jgi:hypothetical protein
MKELRGIIGHRVGWARDVIMPGKIAMVSLVYTILAEEMGWYFFGCWATFALPERCGEVVCFADDRSFTDIVVLGNEVLVQEPSCKFEVGICDCSGWICLGD